MFVFIVIVKLLNLQLFTFLPDLNDTMYLCTEYVTEMNLNINY